MTVFYLMEASTIFERSIAMRLTHSDQVWRQKTQIRWQMRPAENEDKDASNGST